MALIFGAIGLLALLIGLRMWLLESRVTLIDGRLTLRRGAIPGIKREQVFYSPAIGSIELKQGMRVNTTQYYGLVLIPRGQKTPITIADSLPNRSDSEALVSMMNAMIGLRGGDWINPPTHGTGNGRD